MLGWVSCLDLVNTTINLISINWVGGWAYGYLNVDVVEQMTSMWSWISNRDNYLSTLDGYLIDWYDKDPLTVPWP